MSFLIAAACASCAAQEAPVNRDPLTIQKARATLLDSKGKKAFYTKRWNLDDLPAYSPEQKVSGAIRLWGSNYFTDGNLGDYWKADFGRFQPEVTLQFHTPTVVVAIPGLVTGVADIGITRKASWQETMSLMRSFNHLPLEITVVTGSYNVAGWSNALCVFVNQANPLGGLTMKQVDGIFGAARTGGWEGVTWHPEFARGPEENIRTWGQLGLTGEWADKPIRLYGLNLEDGQAGLFSKWVLKGSGKWNEDLRMYANYAKPDGTIAISAKMLAEDVGKDPYGIGYGNTEFLGPRIKALRLSRSEGGPFVELNLENVRDRTYPLHDEIYFYLNREPGKPLEPKLKEFIRFVLSREGQDAVQRDGKYLPLTADVVREQRKKLE